MKVRNLKGEKELPKSIRKKRRRRRRRRRRYWKSLMELLKMVLIK